MRDNPVAPLPGNLTNEIALMTFSEFVDFVEGHKHHASETWDYSLEDLNRIYVHEAGQSKNLSFSTGTTGNGKSFVLVRQRTASWEEVGPLWGIIVEDVLYYTRPQILNDYLLQDKYTVSRRVKYLDSILDDLHYDKSELPVVVRNLLLNRERITLRAAQPLEKNKGIGLYAHHGKREIGAALNEWGATLIVVAREYRGTGLGRVLANLWYKWNPEWKSGGFTTYGYEAAYRRWNARVQKFMAYGWYRELLQRGVLSRARLKEILSSYRPRIQYQTLKNLPRTKKQPLVYIEYDRGYYGPSFAIFDRAFLEDNNPDLVYGFGFFRDSGDKTFLYSIDYEPEFKDITTAIALQIARNNNEWIWVGEGYGDYLEWQDFPVIVENNRIQLREDVIPLEGFLEFSKRLEQHDYGQTWNSLLEIAHQKWL